MTGVYIRLRQIHRDGYERTQRERTFVNQGETSLAHALILGFQSPAFQSCEQFSQ